MKANTSEQEMAVPTKNIPKSGRCMIPDQGDPTISNGDQRDGKNALTKGVVKVGALFGVALFCRRLGKLRKVDVEWRTRGRHCENWFSCRRSSRTCNLRALSVIACNVL